MSPPRPSSATRPARSDRWGSFHQASVLLTPATLNIAALESALAAIVAHHDALRLTVDDAGGLFIPPLYTLAKPVSLHRLMTAEKTRRRA